eukprot:Sspe_Gene.6654::Locus_2243_Transcript_3_4_Confidence_0.429_Length_1739::g.6654::m.6654
MGKKTKKRQPAVGAPSDDGGREGVVAVPDPPPFVPKDAGMLVAGPQRWYHVDGGFHFETCCADPWVFCTHAARKAQLIIELYHPDTFLEKLLQASNATRIKVSKDLAGVLEKQPHLAGIEQGALVVIAAMAEVTPCIVRNEVLHVVLNTLKRSDNAAVHYWGMRALGCMECPPGALSAITDSLDRFPTCHPVVEAAVLALRHCPEGVPQVIRGVDCFRGSPCIARSALAALTSIGLPDPEAFSFVTTVIRRFPAYPEVVRLGFAALVSSRSTLTAVPPSALADAVALAKRMLHRHYRHRPVQQKVLTALQYIGMNCGDKSKMLFSEDDLHSITLFLEDCPCAATFGNLLGAAYAIASHLGHLRDDTYHLLASVAQSGLQRFAFRSLVVQKSVQILLLCPRNLTRGLGAASNVCTALRGHHETAVVALPCLQYLALDTSGCSPTMADPVGEALLCTTDPLLLELGCRALLSFLGNGGAQLYMLQQGWGAAFMRAAELYPDNPQIVQLCNDFLAAQL